MMMEEVSSEENAAAAAAPSQVMDQLEEAAQTSVTQASAEQRQATPPRSSSAPNPAAAMSPPTQLPPHLTTPGGPAGSVPPTTGFVPAAGVVRASPPKQYFTPAQTQPVVPPTSPPNVPSLTAVPPAPTSYTNPLPSPGTPAVPAVQAGVVPPTEAISAIDLSGSSEGPPLHTMGQDSEGAGLFGWLSGGIVNKVMEKTKSSVESMITTLDPGMKEVIRTGGEVDLIVTSEKEVKVGAVRQAFQEVFGKATVSGKDSQPSTAPQPVGYTSALKGAEDRIDNLRRKSAIHERQAAVSVENFIAELLPDRWFDLGCIVLRDPDNNIELTAFTTAVPVPANYVMAAQDATPSDYPLRWSGLAVTVGQTINQQNPHIEHSDWHHALTGVSRRELIYLAAKTLAGMYKQRLPQQAH